ncbi:MAG: 3-dehydroquinate synthase [Xanthomonadales bacterium]|nr:3-dehydroquinate synthase [Xanthomonadales bacterium]
MNRTVDVALGERAYQVAIGEGLLTDAAMWQGLRTGAPCLVVSDGNVAPRYGKSVIERLGLTADALHVVPAGEASKTLAHCAGIFSALAAMRATRDATVVALGGGMVGDLAGFAAACWMRGVRLLQVPTTLLAMVDSSVGGKTAVNLPEGKNLVGAFHQPQAVIADTGTLASLPDRELAAGLAEVVKYAAIADPGLMDWLEEHAQALLAREPAAMIEAIAASVRHKAAIVARDEREQGDRALLNFGHTFGHAIEAEDGYRHWLHGEAVAAGMVQAARLSSALGLAPTADAERLAALLARFGLPVRGDPAMPVDALLDHMRLDKKAQADGLRFVLWRGVGRAEVVAGVPGDAVRAVLAAG